MNTQIKPRYYTVNLPEELKLLHSISTKKQLSGDFYRIVQPKIRDEKRKFNSYLIQDPLKRKLEEFGNKGGYLDHLYSQLESVIFENKKPESDSLGDWISIEIECLFKDSDCVNKFIRFIRTNKYSNHVTLKEDRSLRTDSIGQVPHEIVITFKRSQYEMLKHICAFLIEIKTTVNKTCGLHVHFDCRHLTKNQVTRLGNKVKPHIPYLKQMLPKSRRDNRFCQKDMNNFRCSSNSSRYSFINVLAYERHKTIEFRGHSGTIDSVKIINWIEILYKIMDKKLVKDGFMTLDEFISFYKFSPTLSEYIIKRINKFKDNPIDVSTTSDSIEMIIEGSEVA